MERVIEGEVLGRDFSAAGWDREDFLNRFRAARSAVHQGESGGGQMSAAIDAYVNNRRLGDALVPPVTQTIDFYV